MTILDIKNLSFSYKKGTPVFQGASMQIAEKQITAVYGASGSGKSTFLNVLCLLHKELDSCEVDGEVWYKGENILALTRDFWRVRRNIIYISQSPNPFHSSIWKNMVFPLKINGVTNKQLVEEKITQALLDVNLFDEVKDRLEHPAAELSGGQKQKLCFARALVLRPDVLLMDEPTSSLDEENQTVIEELIKRLGKDNTIVFVSHDMAQINRIANHIYKCENGEVVPG